MNRIIYFIALTVLSFTEVRSQKIVSGFRIDFEQDFLLEYMGLSRLNSDRNYTQGAGISVFSPWLTAKLFEKSLAGTNKIYGATSDVILLAPLELSLQIAGFTPDDLRPSTPIVGDRPYSTVLFLSGKLSTLNASRLKAKTKGLYLGVLGIPDVARRLQTRIHVGMNDGNTKPPWNPMGWHNQISNGGEPTLMYVFSEQRLLTKSKIQREIAQGGAEISNRKFQSTWSYGYRLGYLTQATVGINARFGRVDLANFTTDLFNNLGVIANAGGGSSDSIRSYFNRKRIKELYLYGSIDATASLYNGSLHGQFKKTNYRLPYEQTGFIVSQARLGLAYTTPHFTASMYWAFKSPEMWNAYSRIHSWGGASIGFNF